MRTGTCGRATGVRFVNGLWHGALLIAFLAGAASCGDSPTSPPSTRTLLAFTSSADRGWSSIDVFVNGRSVGTLTAHVEPETPASCNASNGHVVAEVVEGGTYDWFARGNTGVQWNGRTTVSSDGCHEIRLTCTSRDCSPATSTPGTTQLPTLQCRATSSTTITVTISNRSSYSVDVSFQGPTNSSVRLSANSNRTITVNAGQYRIDMVAVGASNVLPASRTQALQSGCDYTLDISVS